MSFFSLNFAQSNYIPVIEIRNTVILIGMDTKANINKIFTNICIKNKQNYNTTNSSDFRVQRLNPRYTSLSSRQTKKSKKNKISLALSPALVGIERVLRER